MIKMLMRHVPEDETRLLDEAGFLNRKSRCRFVNPDPIAWYKDSSSTNTHKACT